MTKGPVIGAQRTLQDAQRAIDNIRQYLVALGDLKGDPGPPGPAGTRISPATIVATETSFGQTPAVGASANYAREDHTHGSPADPVPAHDSAANPHPQYLSPLSSLPSYASNALAIAGGLTAGRLYRNGDAVCVVH